MRPSGVWLSVTYRRLWAYLLVGVTVCFLAIAPYAAMAQQSDLAGNQVDGFPVVLDGKEVFRVRQGIPGIASAEERARLITRRLEQVAADPAITPDMIRVEDKDNASVVIAGETILMTVREGDRTNNLTHQAAAKKAAELIQAAVIQYRHDRSARQIIQGIALAILSTIILIIFLILVQRLSSRLLIRIRAARQADRLNFRIQDFQVLSSNASGYLLSGLLSLLRLVLILGAFYVYIPFLLSQFPATRAIGQSVLSDIANRINQAAIAVVHYLPNLIIILIIGFITDYVIRFAELVISELGRDDVYPWFYPEWVEPTKRLATFLLVAIALIIAAPFLPGFDSPAFQGISLFLGALFTLGSSSAVANAIAGIILIYTRAFRIGDIIRIGETTGKVIEKSLFVTRLFTFKHEVITIPNASVLNNNVLNFNAAPRLTASYLVLYTKVTLGYDLPWRKVHDVLIQAALATPGIVAEPQPFVLQTALNDFNVSYEINAFTDRPDILPIVYSELHQNIQDYCNQAGIEILSPTYTSLRDGNHTTIPADYLPEDYTAPGFHIQSQ